MVFRAHKIKGTRYIVHEDALANADKAKTGMSWDELVGHLAVRTSRVREGTDDEIAEVRGVNQGMHLVDSVARHRFDQGELAERIHSNVNMIKSGPFDDKIQKKSVEAFFKHLKETGIIKDIPKQ